MSDTDITPEILRSVADGARRTVHLGAHGTINALLKWADWLERQQADDKRIDELAQVLAGAMRAENSVWTRWSDLDEDEREGWRSGIRAVLAKLDEERDQPFDKGGPTVRPLRQWGDLRDVPDDVLAVFTPHGNARRDGNAPNGWRWAHGANVTAAGLTSHDYYIEIPQGTR